MDQAYNKLKSKHSLDIVFILIGLAIVALTIYVKQPLLLFFAVFPLSLGILAFIGNNKNMKELNYIKDNYQTDALKCMKIIDRRIKTKVRAIGHELYDIEFGSHKDVRESKSDYVRKSKDLEALKEIKAEIEKHIPVDFSTY